MILKKPISKFYYLFEAEIKINQDHKVCGTLFHCDLGLKNYIPYNDWYNYILSKWYYFYSQPIEDPITIIIKPFQKDPYHCDIHPGMARTVGKLIKHDNFWQKTIICADFVDEKKHCLLYDILGRENLKNVSYLECLPKTNLDFFEFGHRIRDKFMRDLSNELFVDWTNKRLKHSYSLTSDKYPTLIMNGESNIIKKSVHLEDYESTIQALRTLFQAADNEWSNNFVDLKLDKYDKSLYPVD